MSSSSSHRLTRALLAGFTTLALTTACTAAAGTEATDTTGAGESPSAAGNVITTPGSTPAADGTGAAVVSSDELFDSSAVHSIEITYDETEYQAMIDTFVSSGTKEWIAGTVTIDGTIYENVGLKLKGNSSLQGLRGQDGAPGQAADTTGSTEGEQARGMRGGGPGGDVSADDPAGLPWRIRLDKFVEGQNHLGQTDLVVRGNNTETSLNEAVALELLGEAGLATQEAISTRFSVNGSEQQLRLIVQNPNDVWYGENFDSAGLLWKAEAGGDYTYRGDDASDYTDVFDLEAATATEDWAPLTGFLKWLHESDDATFAAALGEHLDIDAFATYLAVQELVNNSDDIDGPGNNSYLQYDTGTGLFTVTAWDQNLSFGGMGGGMGGGGFPGGAGGGGFPGGGTPPTDLQLPDGATPPTDLALPDGATPPTGQAAPQGTDDPAPTGQGARGPAGMGGGGMAGGGMGGRGGNILSEKFLANADFEALYQEKLTALTEQLYTDGSAQEILDRWVGVLQQATDLVPADTIAGEAEAISEQFTA